MNSANLRFRILAGACGLLAAAALLGAGALYTRSTRLARGRAPVESLSALQPRPVNLFGVNVALLGQAAPSQQQALDTIAAAGFGWIRQSFRWDEFEPAPGQFTWGAADELVAATARSGLQLIAVLEGSPAWARPAHADAPLTAPPQDGNAFAAFAGAFAARYGDRIDVYQVWDEPNLQVGWGGEPPNAAAYAELLAPTYEAIHTADNGATVLLAGLAPTIETGPQNVSDVVYLRQLYEQQADAYFDAVAAKPYGFATHPADRDLGPDVLNFSRMILLHEEMAAAGDGDALVWASNFGWNHLPSDWTGGVSVWDATAAADQAWRTLAAYERARAEWPWAGVLVLENYQPEAAPDDPRWGFALIGPDGTETQTLAVLRANLPELGAAAPSGVHPADTPHAQYTGNWKFSELGADIPAAGLAEVTIQFDGTDFGLIARRDNYRAYLYVEVDGRPANALPINADGEAYAVLTSGDYRPHTEVIWLARGLAPGRHTAKIRADRGWDQWAFAGYVVGDDAFGAGNSWPLPVLVGLAVVGLAGAFHFGRQARSWNTARPGGRAAAGQLAAAAILAALVWAGAWLTWGTEAVQAVRRYGDSRPLLVTAATIGLFYFSPQLIVTLLSLAGLFIALLLRPEFALPLAAFFTPFYLLPRPLFERAFSLVEIVVLFAGAALALHVVAHRVVRARGKAGALARPIQIAPLDW
ncbi:MAG: hypothetical protein ACE5FI_16040, partial [Anaerolineales bacterium]